MCSMSLPRVIHAITPGDHFSPRTGSAIPTVVHGLASAAIAGGDARHAVVLDRTTYRPRYESAEVIECEPSRRPSRRDYLLDAGQAFLGGRRPATAEYYRPVVEAVRALPPAILLAHNAPILPWLLRDTAHQVVVYAHNHLFGTYGRPELSRRLATAAAIVCVSEWLAERTRRRLPTRLRSRVHAVGNGVDVVSFHPATEEPRRAMKRVMYVGRVTPQKGVDVLVRAAASLNRQDIEVVIVGRPGFAPDAPLSDYELELRRLAARTRTRLSFEGFVDRTELPALLRTADAFVLPSRGAESWGLTAGEAMATGLPVVASRIGGVPEVIGDAGVLVEPDNPRALAAALASLISDSVERTRLGRAARARVEAHDWDWAWSRLRLVLTTI